MALRGRARQGWLALHRQLAWTVGLWWLLMGVTGSVLVFYPTLDRWLGPVPVSAHSAARAVAASPSEVLAVLQRHFPERTGPWRIELPLEAGGVWTARYYRPQERASAFFAPLMVTLDPQTLEPVQARFWGDYAVTWVYDLHYSLLLGATGRQVVGWLGVLGTVSLLSGLALWWPHRSSAASALSWRWRQGAARWYYDVHTSVGVYSGGALLVLALTGVLLAWPDAARWVLQMPPPMAPATVNAEPASPALPLDAVVALGRQRYPAAELRWVEAAYPSPVGVASPVVLRLYQAGEPGRRFPKTQVWLHPGTGEVLASHDPKAASWGAAVHAWLHPLHNGEALGLLGRWLVVVVGAAPVVLGWSGWRRWCVKREARRLALSRPLR